MDERQRAPGRPCKALCLRDPLSYMERAVMGGVRLGLTSKAMAHKLGVHEGTVKRIKSRVP